MRTIAIVGAAQTYAENKGPPLPERGMGLCLDNQAEVTGISACAPKAFNL